MGNKFSESDPFEIEELDVIEDIVDDDLNPERIRPYEDDRSYARQRERVRSVHSRGKKRVKRNQYGWAFFLCSMFTGLGFTAVTGNPLPLFLGLGVGFLFFVDPIYEKVMEVIDRL